CVVLVPPALLALVLPISLAGWGGRGGGLVAAFSLVHADPAAGAAASVMLGLTTPLAGAGAGRASLVFAGGDVPPKRSPRCGITREPSVLRSTSSGRILLCCRTSAPYSMSMACARLSFVRTTELTSDRMNAGSIQTTVATAPHCRN